ncbi:MAG: YqcC family protein [Deltaproteobacteria bacterium]
MKPIDPEDVRARLDTVVATLKATGAWDVERPSDDKLVDAGPFGMHTLAFEQWLRYVFVPSVEALIASHGPWPTESMVAAHATREWDGHPNPDDMLSALAAFDALFTPASAPPPPEPPPSPAAEAYERSRAAFAAGDHAAALEAIRLALGADPKYPNARNYAGWILQHLPSRTAADLDEAITHYRAAMDVAPDDPVPLSNLCDALVAAGRDADAIAEAERAAASTHEWKRTVGAHNWLGWKLMERPETLDRAIEHLRQAVNWRWRWGVARVNLGKALELAHRGDEMYEQLASALQCEDDFDRAFCHERIAAYQARHGWFRNALGSMRAARREDDKRGGARRGPYDEGITWIEQQLRAAAIEPVSGEREREEAWMRACELEIPAGFLAKNECGEPLADDVVEVERLVRAERWADAAAQLEKLRASDYNKLFDAVGYAEAGAKRARHAGQHAEAIAMMRLVVEAYRYYASGATSGGEGMARMADVDRVRAKLAAWESE